MRRHAPLLVALLVPALLAAQTPSAPVAVDGVLQQFIRFADIFGGRLVAAFDSIPAERYDFRPTPAQQSIGFIAQHLEGANYALCERMGAHRYAATAKDSLADSIKARWPKDTLVARLRASLDFCDLALQDAGPVTSAARASTLLAFETDLAEHYSQLATYMRIIGLVPPSALPPRPRKAIAVPAASLTQFIGTYQLAAGAELQVTMRDGSLYIASNLGGAPARLWPESAHDFFLREVDAQVSFMRDAAGTVTGLVLHQYGRDRTAKRLRSE
jgi:hypothetical protein